MRNLSDASQIKNLLVQQFGDQWRGAYQAYKEVMSKPYQAILINNDPLSDPKMRILTNITDQYPISYVPIGV